MKPDVDKTDQTDKEGPLPDEHFIGMLSGTSRDGVDAVLINFSRGDIRILHAICVQYPAALRQKLDQLLETGKAPGKDVSGALDEQLGRFFARVAQNLVAEAGMEMRDIDAIGSHGQNVWHQPDGDEPVSIQLGSPALIAKNTSTVTVGNFRMADVNAGGQGAPLAPLLHLQLFQSDQEERAVLNLGGIANLTLLPATGGVSGFDCGPGNCLMDAWTMRHLQQTYDKNGRWAASGKVDEDLLQCLLQDAYFQQAPPKSTGLEHFNISWLDHLLSGRDLSPADVQATLAELTAKSAAQSLHSAGGAKRMLVCGGGTHNGLLMRRLAAALPEVIVETTSRYGVDPDWVEGLLFAWLARERINQRPQNTKPITGARHEVLLGDIHHPPAKTVLR
jgi:anhydro-N-acetylmuramic acid kinase